MQFKLVLCFSNSIKVEYWFFFWTHIYCCKLQTQKIGLMSSVNMENWKLMQNAAKEPEFFGEIGRFLCSRVVRASAFRSIGPSESGLCRSGGQNFFSHFFISFHVRRLLLAKISTTNAKDHIFTLKMGWKRRFLICWVSVLLRRLSCLHLG